MNSVVYLVCPLPPRQAMGGRPKKHIPQAFILPATPPPPAKRNGARGSNSREKCRFLPLRTIIWRKGVRTTPDTRWSPPRPFFLLVPFPQGGKKWPGGHVVKL